MKTIHLVKSFRLREMLNDCLVDFKIGGSEGETHKGDKIEVVQ